MRADFEKKKKLSTTKILKTNFRMMLHLYFSIHIIIFTYLKMTTDVFQCMKFNVDKK